LTVRDDERSKSPETLESLVAVLLRSVLVDRRTWESGIATADLLCLPDEVLEKVSLILDEE
jgi:hypothetical protein